MTPFSNRAPQSWGVTERGEGRRLSASWSPVLKTWVICWARRTLRTFYSATRHGHVYKTILITLQRKMNYRDNMADVFLDEYSLEI